MDKIIDGRLSKPYAYLKLKYQIQIHIDTDNLFCLNTLLLRLHVQNVSTKNITHIRSDWDWEAAKGPPRLSSQAATQYILQYTRMFLC